MYTSKLRENTIYNCPVIHWNNEILRCKSNKAYLESICWELQDADERSQRWSEYMERHVHELKDLI